MGNLEVVNKLIEAGANLEAKTTFDIIPYTSGATPLHGAAEVSISQYLLIFIRTISTPQNIHICTVHAHTCILPYYVIT